MHSKRWLVLPILFVVTACAFAGFLVYTSGKLDEKARLLHQTVHPWTREELYDQQVANFFLAIIALIVAAWVIHSLVYLVNCWRDFRQQTALARERRRQITLRIAVPGILVLYLLAFGPAWWIATTIPQSGGSFFAQICNKAYEPIIWLAIENPTTLRKPIMSYARVGARREVILNYGMREIELW
jgi:hypothetical protein